MKKITVIGFLTAICLSFCPAFAETEVSVEFNGRELEFDQPAIISENRTLVPVRKIFEALGAELTWDDNTRTAYSEKGTRKVSITIGEKYIVVDGEQKEIDVPAKIINNRTLIPLRAISDAYECAVEWDSVLKTAKIYDIEFYNAPKSDFEGKFKYFSDVNFAQSGNTASWKSGECVLTFEREESNDVQVDDGYLQDLEKGLSAFKSMTVDYVKKTMGKNIAEIKCYNKGKSIYYLYANKDGTAYNMALTVPDGASDNDICKLMYTLNNFKCTF